MPRTFADDLIDDGRNAYVSDFAKDVTLVRGNDSVSARATPILRQYEVVDDNGLMTLVESWDWIFTAADLVLNNNPLRPTKGWQLRDANDVRYDVMPIGSQPAIQFLDSFETLVVVHSKRVSD